MSFEPFTQPPAWRIRPVPIRPKILSFLRSSWPPHPSWSAKISTIHEESVTLYCYTSFVRQNIIMPLSGNGDAIRSIQATLSQIHIYYMLEQAQPTHIMTPSQIHTYQKYWNRLSWHYPSLCLTQAYYRNWNRLNPCALTLWAKFRHVTCIKAGICSTYTHYCIQTNTLQWFGMGSPYMPHHYEPNPHTL